MQSQVFLACSRIPRVSLSRRVGAACMTLNQLTHTPTCNTSAGRAQFVGQHEPLLIMKQRLLIAEPFFADGRQGAPAGRRPNRSPSCCRLRTSLVFLRALPHSLQGWEERQRKEEGDSVEAREREDWVHGPKVCTYASQVRVTTDSTFCSTSVTWDEFQSTPPRVRGSVVAL